MKHILLSLAVAGLLTGVMSTPAAVAATSDVCRAKCATAYPDHGKADKRNRDACRSSCMTGSQSNASTPKPKPKK